VVITPVNRWLRAGSSGLLTMVAVVTVLAGPARADVDGFAVGDSVMLGAQWVLHHRGFEVDAQKSRQAGAGPSVLRKQGSGLQSAVVVHLGTNGVFPAETCDRLVDQVGTKRMLFLVTVKVPRSWERSNNRTIRDCATRFDNVRIVDWNLEATTNPQWLYDDGVHLRPEGAKAFARLISQAVRSAQDEHDVPDQQGAVPR